MLTTRQGRYIVNQETEIARKKQLLKQARQQIILAMKDDTTETLIKIDCEPFKEDSPLVRHVYIFQMKSSYVVFLHKALVHFDDDQQIKDFISEFRPGYFIHPAIEILKKLNPENNLRIDKVIRYLMDFYHEQNIGSPNEIMHLVTCLADNITCSKSEEIWTLSGEHGSPELLMSNDFSYEGVLKAIKDKHERNIFERGVLEGRETALRDLNLFPVKRAKKNDRSKSEERYQNNSDGFKMRIIG